MRGGKLLEQGYPGPPSLEFPEPQASMFFRASAYINNWMKKYFPKCMGQVRGSGLPMKI